MRRWGFFLAICFSVLAFGVPIQDHQIDPAALAQLASALDISKEASIVDATQRNWLRKPGQERWEIPELSSDEREFVLHWAAEQGLFAAWKPGSCCYDKALILGATTSRMQSRLEYLVQLWNEGVRFTEIVWLTGDRPLDSRVDDLTDRSATESEVARLLWEEADLPEEMRALPAVFIAVPMKLEGSSFKRPNTEDTLIAWLQATPEPCRALFVSDQPFCGYQFAVIKATLPELFLFDVVGQGADPTSHPAAAAITLDSIARWIYQESLIANSKISE